MKKLITTLTILGMISPIFVHAQTIDQDQIRALLISLMNQVIVLEQELITLQANTTSTVTIQNSATTTQIVVTQNQTTTYEVQTPPIVTQPVITPPVIITPSELALGATPIIPSCSVSISVDTNNQSQGDMVWTSQGIPAGTMGWLRESYKTVAGKSDFEYGYALDSRGNPGWGGNGSQVSSTQGTMTVIDPNSAYRLDFNGTYCYANAH